MPTVAVNAPKTPVTQGSSGIAAATLPNICKMPGPPAPFVPTPLPNIGKSDNSPQGYSTTVTIEGNPVAIQGASFNSTGDVASQGTGGGIVSNNVQGPTKFVAPGSLDVQIEGKNVQLLGDQMLNNCGPSGSPPNAATMGGVLQSPEMVKADLQKIADECNKKVNAEAGYPPGKPSGRECTILGTKKHTCCDKAIKAENSSSVKSEESFTASGQPAARGAPLRPDVVVLGADGAVKEVFDFKFNCKSQPSMSKTQRGKYFRAFKVKPTLVHAW
jgi:uncharacterized Zn-binding protein involved in type VI secretion